MSILRKNLKDLFSEEAAEFPQFSGVKIADVRTTGSAVTDRHRMTDFAVIRVLCGPRLKDGETVNFYYEPYVLAAEKDRAVVLPTENAVLFAGNPLCVEWESYMSIVKPALIKGGFEILEAPNEYFKNFTKQLLIAVNNHTHQTVIVTADDRSMYHAQLLAALPLYVPWLFKDAPPSETEMRLLKLLCNTKNGEFSFIDTMSNLFEISKSLGFTEWITLNRLKNMKRSFYETRLRELELELSNSIGRIKSIQDNLSREYAHRQTIDDDILATEQLKSTAKADDELIDYLSVCDNVSLTGISETTQAIRLTVDDTLEFYDDDEARRLVEDEESRFYHSFARTENMLTVEDSKLLATAVFIDKRIRLMLRGAYDLYLFGERIGGFVPGYIEPDEDDRWNCDESLPNPHLHYYHCIGGYTNELFDALRDGNIIGAINLCIASTKSVNFREGPTVTHLAKDFSTPGRHCFVLPDGTTATAAEAVEFLKKEAEHR